MKKSKGKGVIVKNASGPMEGTTEPRSTSNDDGEDEMKTSEKKVKFEVNGDASDEDDDDADEVEEGGKMEKRKADEDEADSSDSESDSSSSSDDEDDEESDSDDSSDGRATKKTSAKQKKMEASNVGVQITRQEVVDLMAVDAQTRSVEFTVPVGICSPNVLVLELAQEAAVKTVIRETPGIKQTFIVGKPASEDPTGKQPLSVQTDGISFSAAWSHSDLIDVNNIKSNSVWDIMQTLGVEAGRATLVSEVQAVFAVYGIGVDSRHLSLIGDFMTQQGEYRPCNRSGIEKSTSPFLKMSYETATAFLTDATIRGETDTLSSPSSRIVVGRTVDLGTGSFGLKYDVAAGQRYQSKLKNSSASKHVQF